MNAILAFCLLIVPLVCFVFGAVLEFRRDRTSLRSVARILPLAVAGAASVLLLIPLTVYLRCTSISTELLSKTMSVTGLLVAPCGFLCRYKSRFAAVLIVFGGMVLAFFWMLNRVIA
jgi:hypothetical protein